MGGAPFIACPYYEMTNKEMLSRSSVLNQFERAVFLNWIIEQGVQVGSIVRNLPV